MKHMIKDKRSCKVKAIDNIFSLLFKLSFLKEKIKIISDRISVLYNGYKFSYDSSENGEDEFINHLAALYNKRCFRFFDVGAHHGTYSALIVEYFDDYSGQLFEPTPASYKKLSAKYGKNQSLKLNNAALSNFNGQAQFIQYPDDPTRNGLSGVGREVTFKSEDILCDVLRGDDYCKSEHIDSFHLLKIDAEGHDFNVIDGFEQLITAKKIDVIQFEYTFKHADIGIPLRRYYEFFESRGYKIGPVRKFGIDFYEEFDPRFNQYELGPNYVAVKLELVDRFRRFTAG